jgi:hypothetical protein
MYSTLRRRVTPLCVHGRPISAGLSTSTSAWRRSTALLAGLGWVLVGLPSAQADESLGVDIEASITTDDNVTRGYGDGNVLPDWFVGASIGKNLRFPVSTHTRLSVLGFAGFNTYREYTGLSHSYAGVQGDFQYRPSAGFFAPTYALSVRAAFEEYHSMARDGNRVSAGLSVRKPLTDQVRLAGALNYNWRDGKSAVFDTSDVALRTSADFAITRRDTLYLGLEYRNGDIVSTGQPSTDYVDIATAIVLDDAFEDTARYAYKIDGSTWLLNLGYNRAFGERHALDLSWRMANATPSSVAGASAAAGRIHYTVNQFTLAYLVRF